MSPKRWLIIFGLVIVAVATRIWVLKNLDEDSASPLPEARSDYLLENFSLTIMNDDGLRRFSLHAPHLERSPVDESTLLTAPDVLIFEDNRATWRSTGETGWISADGTELRLEDDVTMESIDGQDTTVVTDTITFLPDDRLAHTQDAVTLTQADSVMTGIGLRANFQSQTWELLADVKARFTVADR